MYIYIYVYTYMTTIMMHNYDALLNFSTALSPSATA